MDEFNPRTGCRELDVDFFLDSGRGLDRLDEPHQAAMLFNGNREVVWEIRARLCFGRMPEPVASIEPPLLAATLAQLGRVFLEQVLAADEAKPDHARPDVGSDNEFDFAVGNPTAIFPTPVRNFLDGQAHGIK